MKSEFMSAFRIASDVFKKLAEAVQNEGGSDEDLRRLETDGDLRREIAKLIVGEKEIAKPDFPIWKSLTLGTGLRTASDFCEVLKQADCQISEWAKDLLNQPAFTASVSQTETEVELVIVSVAELGFKEGATYSQICARAKELGLELCPAEVGPQLRLNYLDQPLNGWLWVAMEPISGPGGGLYVFGVERGGDGLWLRSRDGHSGSFWDDCDRFVFVRRKPARLNDVSRSGG